MWFILVKKFKFDPIFHATSGVGPFSVDFIRLYWFCFLHFSISLLNLHDQLHLLLVFNLDDIFKIPFSYYFHRCCKPAVSGQDFFN